MRNKYAYVKHIPTNIDLAARIDFSESSDELPVMPPRPPPTTMARSLAMALWVCQYCIVRSRDMADEYNHAHSYLLKALTDSLRVS